MAQKRALSAAEQGDIGEDFRPSQHRKQAERQDLVDRVGYLALLARILEVLEIAQENNRRVKRGTVRSGSVDDCPR
jgi:hypothetical protein